MSAADFCTVAASTKRNAAAAGNQTGAAVTYLASLAITPLWPASQETIRLLDLPSPREIKECYHCPASGTTLPDVKEGDTLVIGSSSYPIDHVAEWTDGAIPTLHIIVGEVKAT